MVPATRSIQVPCPIATEVAGGDNWHPVLGPLRAAGTRIRWGRSSLCVSPPTRVQTWAQLPSPSPSPQGHPLAVAQAPASSSTQLPLGSRPRGTTVTCFGTGPKVPGQGGVGTPCLPFVLLPEGLAQVPGSMVTGRRGMFVGTAEPNVAGIIEAVAGNRKEAPGWWDPGPAPSPLCK